MPLRVIEAHVPPELVADALEVLREFGEDHWEQPGGRFGAVAKAVIGAGRTGEAMDALHSRLAERGGLLVLVQPLDGVLPRPTATHASERRERRSSSASVSREEVYASIADSAQLSRGYVTLVVLASIVAGIGLARDNTAAVIGAMVVAPLLGPNMALALGLVLGDGPLVRRSLWTNAVGIAVAFAAATVLGLGLSPDPTVPELAARTHVGVSDLVIALAAGCAGALSYTTGVPAYLTGVMVAVALLPPTAASGMLLAAGAPAGAAAALLLAAGNVTALTLSAMLTFLWRGMRPRNWWQEDRAKTSARRGVAIFLGLFVLLAAVIVAAGRYFGG